ncbi:TonB-dependent receptor [Sphingomonas sp. CA1-15]|uniref:TonB-dependent receptor n=1 Tax=Sphingomonas immobilis TaxID=3063997 RepID=A0ABT9A1B2_9SPHN|nr:TonB-dependent receptor [Sphingomonas sp. CA1-15]MDO7843595.1 TonB-dependent receptor [Sphingomonas sp. CA1-15]
MVDVLPAPALKGKLSVEEAIATLLEGSGLRARASGAGLFIEAVSQAADTHDDDHATDVLVTGSRIRGAKVASPVITLDRDAIRDSGKATIVDALRSLPQNFGGGQNPGIGFNVPEGSGQQTGGGASINLRGLGSDATLTLLDGHRVSYSVSKQSVDISSIPLGAIGRIDIVPDGASALYGSDAVAGVVNIVLRRDLNGIETGFTIGGATDGGDLTQIYSLTAGKIWRTGSAFIAYEYGDTSEINANQRAYAATRRPNLDLFPAQRRHSVLGRVQQQLGDTLTVAVDATFNKRWSGLWYSQDPSGNLSISRTHNYGVAQSYGLAGSLDWSLGNWVATLSGNLGQDRVDYAGDTFTGTVGRSIGRGFYRNSARAVELSGNGALFALPGGPAKLAVGTGYRHIDFERFNGAGNSQNTSHDQADYYAFGELSLPLLAKDQHLPLLDSLVLSAAARYEHYNHVGDVLTPKFGIIAALGPDVSIKGSWGQSFRAPTLYQGYQPVQAYLGTASLVGGTGYPAGSTSILLLGGNPNLKPERSTNWSATLDLHPRALDGLSLEISYFSVHYRDRIITPIPDYSVSLANPGYANFVSLNPGSAELAAALGGAATITNLTSGTYDPTKVIAIVYNNNINAGRQVIQGIDALGRYKAPLAGGTLSVMADAAYLESDQQISPTLPVTQKAGIIFNPPHLRLRGELGWNAGGLTISGAVTRIGPVLDNRIATTARVPGMTPVDLTVRYKVTEGPARGVDITASVQNLFNAQPSPITTSFPTDTPYDSTNYSAVGRFLSLSVIKKW